MIWVVTLWVNVIESGENSKSLLRPSYFFVLGSSIGYSMLVRPLLGCVKVVAFVAPLKFWQCPAFSVDIHQRQESYIREAHQPFSESVKVVVCVGLVNREFGMLLLMDGVQVAVVPEVLV